MGLNRLSAEDRRLRKNANQRQWRATNPEKAKAIGQRNLARHPRNRQWVSLQSRAKRQGLDVTITFEFFCGLRDPNQCHYCGGSLPVLGSGIDRKNPALGYTIGNCIPCCELHNKMKWIMDYDTFLIECRAIAERFRG